MQTPAPQSDQVSQFGVIQFGTALCAFATGPVQATAAAQRIIKLSALDWFACGLAGQQEPVSLLLRNQALSDAGGTQSRLFGGGQVSARAAALVNGAISHALDYDDTHFAHIGHPSVAVFPTVFALGEKLNKPLTEVLEAALTGIEVSIRVGLWLGRTHYQTGFHQTATAGAFGATVAAGRLLGLNSDQMAAALGLAATRAAGLKAQFGTMGKPYNAGLAASCGVEIAELIAAGFDANSAAFDGPLGFGETHHGEMNSAQALQGLGQDWLCENISHKFHACCHGLHAALEAARGLDLAAPEIANLTVRTHPRWMTVCNQIAPETGLGAKFSYRTVLAMQALGIDTARLESYSDAIAIDPRVIALRDHIDVIPDDSLGETEAHISLLRRDGKRFDANHDLTVAEDYPTRKARILEKSNALIGADLTAQYWALLRADTKLAAMSELMAQPL